MTMVPVAMMGDYQVPKCHIQLYIVRLARSYTQANKALRSPLYRMQRSLSDINDLGEGQPPYYGGFRASILTWLHLPRNRTYTFLFNVSSKHGERSNITPLQVFTSRYYLRSFSRNIGK